MIATTDVLALLVYFCFYHELESHGLQMLELSLSGRISRLAKNGVSFYPVLRKVYLWRISFENKKTCLVLLWQETPMFTFLNIIFTKLSSLAMMKCLLVFY